MEKLCRDCGLRLPLDDFYRHHQMADGHLNVCRSCVCRNVRTRRAKDESVREYDRNRAKLPHRKALNRRVVKQYRADHPDRYKANTAVGNALRDGLLKKEPCFFCEAEEVHAHHADYSKPLDVKWLCVKCHRRLHSIAPDHMVG